MLFSLGQHIIDAIFPPRESELIIRQTKLLPYHNVSTRLLNYPITHLSSFSNPKIHAAITEGKYYHNKRAHKLLGTLLQQHLDASHHHFDHLIPIPLSTRRFKKRGHNQVLSVIKHTSLTPTNALTRTNAESQTHLNRAERIANVADAFSLCCAPEKLAGSHIILLDDVVTTGATLTAAAKVLETAQPASITLIALAH